MMTHADIAALDMLCPMHLVLDPEGIVRHAGPTLIKMRGAKGLIGAHFLDIFEPRRALHAATFQDLTACPQQKLHLRLRNHPFTKLKGIMVPANGHDGAIIVNLSFGISIIDGVRDFALSNADFAATDLAIEMLYLVEAKTAAMEASYRLNDRLEGARSEAAAQATTDALTGIKNRRALNEALQDLLEKGAGFAVMQIDLDHFKAVNDTLGHAAGDKVLRTVAQVMQSETRDKDIIARVGGDEFTVVLTDVRDERILRRAGRRIIDRIEEPVQFQGADCRISASIGSVWIQRGDSPTMQRVLSDADVALYASKNAGRATYTLYRPELREAANAVSPRPNGGVASPEGVRCLRQSDGVVPVDR